MSSDKSRSLRATAGSTKRKTRNLHCMLTLTCLLSVHCLWLHRINTWHAGRQGRRRKALEGRRLGDNAPSSFFTTKPGRCQRGGKTTCFICFANDPRCKLCISVSSHTKCHTIKYKRALVKEAGACCEPPYNKKEHCAHEEGKTKGKRTESKEKKRCAKFRLSNLSRSQRSVEAVEASSNSDVEQQSYWIRGSIWMHTIMV